MSRKAIVLILFAIVLAATWLHASAATDEESDIVVEITQPPRSGVEVGVNMYVEGTASLPAGHHLWVFARRVDFEGFWWPQGEGKVDPVSGDWKVRVTFGGPQDVGWRFDLAAAVFKEDAHAKLKEYQRKAMATGNWPSIEMPEAAAPPQLLQVMKVSHRP